jgi:hypothetical protein
MWKVKIKVSLDLIQLHGVKALEVWRYSCMDCYKLGTRWR